MATTYVSAVITAKDGREDDLAAELAKVVDTVRGEDGCIRYDLHRSDYGNVFFFYEIWESPAHLAAHAKTAHMAAMHEATVDMVAGPAEVNTWQALDVTSATGGRKRPPFLSDRQGRGRSRPCLSA